MPNTEELAAIAAVERGDLVHGHSDQAFITLKSGREYEIEGALDELEAVIWPKRTEDDALVNRWTGERDRG